VISILSALYQKKQGKAGGADICIGLFENCLFLVAQHMVEYEMTGNKPRLDAGTRTCRSTYF
jgi:crotonobetainyl-CoA:carnitine CoA-transferase CaiB-like acyl-CoA transferase